MPKKQTSAKAPVRAFWSGTVTFGLVSVPVDLYSAVQPRHTTMKMADEKGHALGREYFSEDHKEGLKQDQLVRGYETAKGKMVVVTDEDLQSVAPEMTRDIELRVFVKKEEIPPAYFVRPYFLAPSGKSQKAYQLLAGVMAKTGRYGLGTFVMRGKQYFVAIISDGAVLRLETLRFANQLRSPASVGLPKRSKPSAKDVKRLASAVARLTRKDIDPEELSDRYAEAIGKLVEQKMKKHKDVVRMTEGDVSGDDEEGTGNVVDLMKILKQSVAASGSRRRPAHRAGQRSHARSAT